jgi:DNA-binding GntR family transcriptional regulator
VERLVSRTPFVGVTVTQLSPEEVIELLDAIARGDAEGAERLNRERIRHIRDTVAKSISFSIL